MKGQRETANPLYELVFGASKPEVVLLEEGRLPRTWVKDYSTALIEAQSAPTTQLGLAARDGSGGPFCFLLSRPPIWILAPKHGQVES